MSKRELQQKAGASPFSRWLLALAEARGWTSGRQGALYLGVNHATFWAWLKGDMYPEPASQVLLHEKTGEPLARIAQLVATSKIEPVPAASPEIASYQKDQAPADSGTLPAHIAEEVGAYVVAYLAPLLPRLRPPPHTLEEWTRYGEPESAADVEDARVAAGVRGGMGGETGLGDRTMYWRVRITGRCMEPAIPDGGWVLVEPRKDAMVGDTVVVVTEDDQRICKRVVLEDGELMLRADDDTLVRPDENGRVLGVVRYVPMPKRVAVARR